MSLKLNQEIKQLSRKLWYGRFILETLIFSKKKNKSLFEAIKKAIPSNAISGADLISKFHLPIDDSQTGI